MKEYNTKLLKIIIPAITSIITAIITVIFSSPIAYENGQRNGVIEGKEIQQQNNQIQLQEIFGDIININGSNNKIDTNDLKNISNSYVNYEAECSNLQSQIADLQNQINQQNSEKEINNIIQIVTDYWGNSDYIQALTILKNSKSKSSDIELLYEQYSNEYIANLLLQSDILVSEKKYDVAIEELQNGKAIVSDDNMLTNKINEINYIISNKQPIELSQFKITSSRCFNQRDEEFIIDTVGNKYFKGNLFDIYADGKTNYGYATFYLGQKYTSLSGVIAVSDESGEYEGWIEIGYRQDDKFNTLWTSPKLSRITNIIEIKDGDINLIDAQWLEIRYYSGDDYRWNGCYHSLHVILSDVIVYSD